ncbi:PITH domain-containing protein 1-like [Saccoglossus kowalevskii]|uniref:PITH domain-containing protein 1-like n=1 Tax=Saccoglossus kowalevskii TaxID=10224 RepID=A0ABM0GUF9_SACKO|nr:PREDICTED: PITH domain-containing protein 1-like [Saccoglossus kowalevskii]
MADRGHGGHHHHGRCGDEHDHDDDPERGIQYSLYLKIDLMNVECLNEERDGSGKDVFKSWENRLDREKYVVSDADEELLFNIPFTGNVKLKGVIVIGGEDDSHPSQMKLFKNRPKMTFDDAGGEPDQVFEMHPDNTGQLEYATKITKFSGVHHLSIYFSKNFGADTTKVYYIGLRGDFTEAQRQEIVIVNYELAPNPADHKSHLEDHVQQQIQ